MATAPFEFDEHFSVTERASIGLLFDRLRRGNTAPLVLYCVDDHGRPVAVFSSFFSQASIERVGDGITELFASTPENNPR